MRTSIYLNEETGKLIEQLLKTDGRFSSTSDLIRFAILELAKKYKLK